LDKLLTVNIYRTL